MNNNTDRVPMPLSDPENRIHNFEEVALGYNEDEAAVEASRCLNCKNPKCVEGCPVNIDIPGFIGKIKSGKYEAAYDVILKSSSLSAVCGRVCPQENQCEKYCVRGLKGKSVAIGNLERFVSDRYSHKIPELSVKKNGIKIAVVGSGPASLSCSYELALRGYDVSVYEALHKLGGVLVYGIPEFRLPKKLVENEINKLSSVGIKFYKDIIVGKTLTIEDLFEMGYKSVFIGTGAGLPMFLNIPGENYNGVYSANEFLTRINLMNAYSNDSKTPVYKGKNVAVIGGGNVAMDAARCARRLGADSVNVIYRRSENELPARKEEVIHAKEEGIIFNFLSNPKEIKSNGDYKVSSVLVDRMKLGEPDASGRARPEVIPGAEYEIKADCVIVSIGTTPNPLIKNTTDNLAVNGRGCIIVNDNGETSIQNLYAGGDAVSGAATVILAMGAGKKAAESIDNKIKNEQ